MIQPPLFVHFRYTTLLQNIPYFLWDFVFDGIEERNGSLLWENSFGSGEIESPDFRVGRSDPGFPFPACRDRLGNGGDAACPAFPTGSSRGGTSDVSEKALKVVKR